MIKCYRNDEEDVLGLPNGHPGNAGHLLQTQLAHDLPGFFLTWYSQELIIC